VVQRLNKIAKDSKKLEVETKKLVEDEPFPEFPDEFLFA
jgi:hypothetical protein